KKIDLLQFEEDKKPEKIEVAKEGRMDMSGQGLIRAIQNNNMPLLDLFVRESVQNSLDAARESAECVKVDFGVRNFNNSELAEKLEGITERLKDKYGNRECKYLFVRDRETEGLTGPLHFTDRKTEGKKNLLKLVYEIAKPQENAGAGGSWGYGKTVYFRMGIGLVLYYSRILDSNGKYQSRLAACLVEDEKKSDALLSSRQLDSHRGLAWWGREFNYKISNNIESGTIPETNEKEIAKILKVFNFESFIGNETGTAIIIPYINEEKLLKNNITAEGQDAAPWASSLKSYIKIAVQRWYIGRLNNPDYTKIHKQAHLKVSIDGEDLEKRIMAKPFKEIQTLYNLAIKGESSKDNYYCEPIKINNYFESTIAGHIAYKMFSPEEMEMTAPTNNPSPFVFVKNEDGE
ncbi:MAG: hypothetical protein HUJ63_02230, partial [Enterococcus sp.]|nr:hypothetical protein [Enterococcus sp.]